MHYHIIIVCDTPASGKTTLMQLVAHKLLETYGNMKPIHTLVGWDRDDVSEATGWNATCPRHLLAADLCLKNGGFLG
jgi:hypothetical protein